VKFFRSSRHQQTFELQGFSKLRALELLTKGADKSVARRTIDFLKRTRTQLFRNPLMLSLLSLVIDQYADLPESEEVLFDMAIETLLYRHDASKGSFRRESVLPHDEMRSLLSAISLMMVVQGNASVSRSEFGSLVERGIELFGLAQGKEHSLRSGTVVEELVERGLIVEHEPGHFGLPHRSLQEHLAVAGASRLPENAEIFSKLLISVLHANHRRQLVIKLARGWIRSPSRGDALLQQLNLAAQGGAGKEAASLAEIMRSLRVEIDHLRERQDSILKFTLND
jgi:hypothetical protein